MINESLTCLKTKWGQHMIDESLTVSFEAIAVIISNCMCCCVVPARDGGHSTHQLRATTERSVEYTYISHVTFQLCCISTSTLVRL